MPANDTTAVAIIGGGVAGQAAGIFTARHGLETVILDSGDSLLKRNAHLENYPGFPTGVDARFLLSQMREQTELAGCRWVDATVHQVNQAEDGFTIETTGDQLVARYVIAATKNSVAYLDHLNEIDVIQRGSKTFLEVDRRGRTTIEGLYAAGRLALEPHQTIVCAGHGAKIGFTILEDDDEPFYQDWVAPEGYFTGRGREVPPGCEEIDDKERINREAHSREALRAKLANPFPERPQQHPSVDDN